MEISTAGSKTICVPAPPEADYQKLIKTGSTFRHYLDPLIEKYLNSFQQRFPTVTGFMTLYNPRNSTSRPDGSNW